MHATEIDLDAGVGGGGADGHWADGRGNYPFVNVEVIGPPGPLPKMGESSIPGVYNDERLLISFPSPGL